MNPWTRSMCPCYLMAGVVFNKRSKIKLNSLQCNIVPQRGSDLHDIAPDLEGRRSAGYLGLQITSMKYCKKITAPFIFRYLSHWKTSEGYCIGRLAICAFGNCISESMPCKWISIQKSDNDIEIRACRFMADGRRILIIHFYEFPRTSYTCNITAILLAREK